MATADRGVMRYPTILLLFILPSPAICLQHHTSLPRTTSVPSDGKSAPGPTQAPLAKRADAVPHNICGWFSGSGYDDSWEYYDTQSTCFWHSDYKIIGAPADLFPVITTCVGYQHETPADASTLQCLSALPYCLTVRYNPDYYAWFCTDTPDVTWTMEPTWSGLQTPIFFPIYTGSDGISTGIQYPAGYKSPTGTETTTGVTSTGEDENNEMSTSTATTTGGHLGDQPTTSTSSSSSSSSSRSRSSIPVGAIVGGVIGGLAVIGISGFAILFLIMRSRRSHERERDASGNAQNSPRPYQPPARPLDVQKAELDHQDTQVTLAVGQNGTGPSELLSSNPLPRSALHPSAYDHISPHGLWPTGDIPQEIDSREIPELDAPKYNQKL
ncbi:hypothetical protein BJY01DRAFT_252451 [Aspergillus pseudoustus]|uniref:Mid2 domain-containing protein n=1 Tax=Aspergillus pseudoustus TaxID=1810923 RepID=A0ABR4J6H0_9EURO